MVRVWRLIVGCYTVLWWYSRGWGRWLGLSLLAGVVDDAHGRRCGFELLQHRRLRAGLAGCCTAASAAGFAAAARLRHGGGEV